MKLTPQEIRFLLDDLYMADPSLKDHEKELIQLIQQLAETKPEVKISAMFLKTLQKELISKAKAISPSMKTTPTPMGQKPSRFWPVLGISFSAIAIVLMATLFMTQNMIQFQKSSKNLSNRQSTPETFQAVQINHVDRQAFGALALSTSGSETKNASAVGIGGGAPGRTTTFESSTAPAVAPQPNMSPEQGVAAMDASISNSKRLIMPPYQQTVIEYAYKGESLELNDVSLDVYKRSNTPFSTGNLSSLVQGMNFGITNLSSFNNLAVSDISVYQSQPFGYQIYISPRNGSVSIDQNWEQWQSAYPNCLDEACAQTNQLKESDVPPNDELVKIADDFLAGHGIDLRSYGKGEVDDTWRTVPIPLSADSKIQPARYVPDSMQVIYPLMVNGETAYQNGGGKTGITVSINIRVKKVSNVYGLQASTFDASSYDAITDSNAILDSAKNGGLASPIRYMDAATLNNVKKVQAELGTPSRGLVQTYQYKDNQSFDLYVPALMFPVTKKADDEAVWTPNIVIVPLVKGLEFDVPQIMPMIKSGGVGGGSTEGSSGIVVPTTPAVPPATPSIEPSR
jgi:hypothetical protein